MKMKTIYLCLYVSVLFLTSTINVSYAKDSCLELSMNKLKVEAWLSKTYKKNTLNILKEFKEKGISKIGLFIYPGNNPSRIVAIGRCVPVLHAQHFLKKANKYSLGTTHLVNQGFISSHWTGLGSSLFSENSMNPITPDQLALLMEENLDTQSFHALYKSFTVQKKKVPAFGLILDNPKLLSETN
jgi:hypothetical protein